MTSTRTRRAALEAIAPPAAAPLGDAAARALFGWTTFLGSFLLFAVQPLIGRWILPWFGGTPAVWMTCMAFFQVALVAGYLWAHLVASRSSRRGLLLAHGLLLAGALACLPLDPSAAWRPDLTVAPTWRVLAVLAISVGPACVVLAATSPLVQSIHARVLPKRSPYGLYALSNAGSMLALLSYPFLLEPNATLPVQATLWSAAFVVFAVSSVACAALQREPSARPRPRAAGAARAGRGDALDLALWLALAGAGSIVLLGTTNQLCQNVAAVPFLWILPLALYLATFILCFDERLEISRNACGWALAVGLVAAPLAIHYGPRLGFGLVEEIACYSLTLFACCLCAHRELVALKPEPERLTLFYLAIAIGGALGGIFVAFGATHLFEGLWEFPLGLAACVVAVLAARRRESLAAALQRRRGPRLALSLAAGLLLVFASWVGGTWAWRLYMQSAGFVYTTRNFYGLLSISVDGTPAGRRIKLRHGSILHGAQLLAPEHRAVPTLYYGEGSGVALALEQHPRRADASLRIGAVGLGAGTLAAYARGGDELSFYEIDPDVLALAEQHFTFLADARARGARVDVRLGDARLSLEAELERGESGRFDVLAVDAFSGDAIPVHLLTRECFATYLAHLAPGGVLALHVSNHYLDLAPLVARLAAESGHGALVFDGPQRLETNTEASRWMLVSADEEFLQRAERQAVDRSAEAGFPPVRPAAEGPLWTDSFAPLWPLLR